MIAKTQHLLFLDECGSHDMRNVDPAFPVFVLVGLLVGEQYYAKTLVPRLKELKRRHLGNPKAMLHSRDIRRLDGPFTVLRESEEKKREFYDDLNDLYKRGRFRIFTVAIDKAALLKRFLFPVNPYDISLSQLLSLACGPPGTPTVNRPNVVRCTAESRGKREDKELQAEFQRFRNAGLWSYGAADVQNRRPGTVRRVFPQRIEFVRKSKGVSGLELADLAAYPIARAVVNQNWDNPAFRVIFGKLRGFIVFP